MDELIVRIARALACLTRLKILSYLARHKEVMPTVLARDLNMGKAPICMHLRRLSDAGLILRRRSGARCFCVGESPYSQDALSGKMSRWIHGLLAEPVRAVEHYEVKQLRNVSSADAETAIHRLLFEALTAFTNVRRLEIMRRLIAGKPVAVQALMKELSMSDAAVSRHLNKLLRRGYIRGTRRGHHFVYGLSKEHKSCLHKELYDIVAWALGRQTLRS